MPPAPDEELRRAFRRHGEATGRRWQPQVYRISRPDGKLVAVRVELTCEDAGALAALIRAGAGPRSDVTGICLGTAAVAERLNVAETTIRSWLARNLPKQNPFPRPEKLLGRNQWQQATIEAWDVRRIQIEKQKRRERSSDS